MNVHVLDDWQDTVRTLPVFAKVAGHDVTIWNDHTPHLGYVERDGLERMCGTIFDQILAHAAGHPINVVNPAALNSAS